MTLNAEILFFDIVKSTFFRPKLASELRKLFGFFRWLNLALLVLSPLVLVTTPRSGSNSGWRDVTHVYFDPRSAPAHISTASGQPAGLSLSTLAGEVRLHDAEAAGPELTRLARWTRLARQLTLFGLGFLLSHYLWRLCREVERGHVFTESNLALIKRFGASLMVADVVVSGVHTWCQYRIGGYVERHLNFGSLKALATVEETGGLPSLLVRHFRHIYQDGGDLFITGLLVLLLAQVFRQGLALQRDSELTV